MTRAALVSNPIDTGRLLASVSRPANGAAVVFVGMVREVNEGRPVSGLEYSAYASMAEREMTDIANEACDRFGVTDLAIEHRTGALMIGDVAVAVAVGHPHRDAAFDAARYAIEQLKRRVPIWKREAYVDGTREWVEGQVAC